MAPADAPPDPLARAVVGLVGRVARHPRAVLLAGLGLVALSAGLAVTRLEYHTQRNDLLSADKPCQQRWQKYLDAFGDDEDMVVVVEGADRGRMQAALDAVAGRVKARPDLFDRVFHRVDLRGLHDRAVLFLPPDQLDAVRNRVERMDPLLGPLAPLAWPRLNAESLLGQAAGALDGGAKSDADTDLLAQLPAVVRSAAATVREPSDYRNPWAVAGPLTADRDAERHLTEPQYFFTPDGSLGMLLCRPKMAGGSFTPAKEASDALRAVLADAGRDFPDLRLGLTGLPVLESDEMARSDADSQRAAWLALLGVAVLYFVVYRGFRYPLLTVGSLAVGTAWALGWAAVTVGHLNILSATFAVMLIGMGDYGVLWVARYDEERRAGLSVDAALRATAAHAGPGIVTAAAGTAVAFFATMLADFRAVAELGWIAGCGVMFCALSCLTVVPAALVLAESWRAGGVSPPVRSTTGGLTSPARQDLLPYPSAWLPALAHRPRLVLVVGAAVLVGCGVASGRLTYNHNLLDLQPRDLPSVEWERTLIDRAAGMTWDALSVARTPAEAAALRTKYEALPEVGRVVEVASLVPSDQAAKLPAARAIRDHLAGLPPADRLPPPRPSDPVRVRELAGRVRDHPGAGPDLTAAAADLLAALDASTDPAGRLAGFDRRLAADLAADLHRLRAVSRPEPIALADLPAELRERYVGAGGEYLVRAFARESLWDADALGRFTASASSVDPEATGKAFRTREGLRQMKAGFEWAGVYALAAIVLVLGFDLRSARGVLLGLFPLATGVVLTAGAMGLFGVPLNPANLIALPLVVGVGVDNGVHVLHDWRAGRRGVPYRLGPATGRGVLVAGLTTVLGFGTLMTAGHRGMASLGLVLTLGVTFCMIAALVWLPAVLRLLDERPRRANEASSRHEPAAPARAAA